MSWQFWAIIRINFIFLNWLFDLQYSQIILNQFDYLHLKLILESFFCREELNRRGHEYQPRLEERIEERISNGHWLKLFPTLNIFSVSCQSGRPYSKLKLDTLWHKGYTLSCGLYEIHRTHKLSIKMLYYRCNISIWIWFFDGSCRIVKKLWWIKPEFVLYMVQGCVILPLVESF